MADKPRIITKKAPKGGLRCRVLTPQKSVFDEYIASVELTTAAGRLEVFPRFEPTIAPLAIGIMKAKGDDNSETTIAVHGGYMDMNGNVLVVLADSAEIGGEIDVARARQSLARAKELLSKVSTDDVKSVKIDVDRAKLAMMRALNRLAAVGEKPPG